MPGNKQLSLLFLFVGLLVIGLLASNLVLIVMSLVPFFLLLLGLLIKPPHRITVETEHVPPKLRLGREFNLVRKVTIHDGSGLVRLFQALPEEFSLVEGNNLRVCWKGRRPVTVVLSCRIRCSKRGNYSIPSLEWAAYHPLHLATDAGTAGDTLDISVWPHLLKHRQVRSLKDLALSPYPLADVSKIGIPGTDFREIRSYVSGDPVKTINWKATARRGTPVLTWPLVNEFEREGRKAVIIFLDASSAVEIGSTMENVLEYSIEATSNLLYYFIDRGYRVGLAVSSEQSRFFYPDSGRQQLTKIIPQLVRLKAGGQPAQLLNVIDKFHRYILNYKPLSVLVTTLDGKSGDVLEAAFDKLKSYYSLRRRPPIVLVNVIARDLIPRPDGYESNLPLLMQLQASPLPRKLRRAGVTVMEWNPSLQSFHIVLARQVKR